MKAKVILFRASGKYYTEEEWEVPATVPDYSTARGHYLREAIIPEDMRHSPNYRHVGGPVLVEPQEPWGYPCLIMPDLVDVTPLGSPERVLREGLTARERRILDILQED